MEAKTLGRVTSVHGNPVCLDHFARKERRQGGQLFVVDAVIIRYPSKVQKQTTFVYEHS